MDQFLLQFADRYGPLGVALLLIGGLLWLVVRRVLPAMNEAWREEIAAERAARAAEAAAERQVFRDAISAQQSLFRDLFLMQASEDAKRHSLVMNKLDVIGGKVDQLGEAIR